MTQITNVREPLTYAEERQDVSFFQDLARSSLQEDNAATERLVRHQREIDVETRTAPNTTAGTGGEFAPPMWVIEKFATAARAGRVLGDLVTTLVLPPKFSSIHIPKFTTGASAVIQPAQNAPLGDIDAVTADAGTNTDVVTIAGNADVSQQLYDLTPTPGLDGIFFQDLSMDYNQTLEKQMLAGTGGNGQLTGITNVPNIVTVSGAGVSTTQNTMVTNLWTLIGQAAAIVGTQRQLPPEVVLLAPRRYYAIASGEDSQNRPIGTVGLLPNITSLPPAGGALPVDRLLGINTYLSGGIIGNTSTNADYIIVARVHDMLLYESVPRFVAMPNPGSGSLTIRLQLHRYVAFLNFKASSISAVVNIPQPTNF